MKYPTDTLCPVCNNVFIQPIRAQGGGARTIYCSAKCRSLDWVRGNGTKRKATVLKYDEKPENKEKKYLSNRRRMLAKYGLVEADYQSMFARQRGRCAGCESALADGRAAIDHDHATGRVRGLLCTSCNWTIGHAYDDRQRLYQLAAYLELDRSRPVVYLIGSLRNPKIVEVGNAIRDLGLECVDNWFSAGKIADDSWQNYSVARGRSYQEALKSREANHVYFFDRAYLNLSDAVVLLAPAGKSGHLEFGYSIGNGKRGYILDENEPDRFDVMMQFSTVPLLCTRDSLLAVLKNDLLPVELTG